MAKTLPARPHLAYLKKLAKQRLKALRAAGKSAKLAHVQRDLAREYGLPSWRALAVSLAKTLAANTPAFPPADVLESFFRAALPLPQDHASGNLHAAQAILLAHPALADTDVYTAALTGRPSRLRELLAADPHRAVTAGGPRRWLPLSYLCFSRFLRFDPARRSDFLQSARLLLRVGADPNTFFINEGDNVKESALYGAAGLANDSALTKLLLDAGADVNDGESLYHTAEHADHTCLKLLLERQPKPEWVSYCLCHKMDFEDPAGVALFLRHGADPNFLIRTGAAAGLRPLHFAILRNRTTKTLRVLLDAGADPNLTSRDGLAPYAFARRLGRTKLAEFLRRHGAQNNLTESERFLAALSIGDIATANKMHRRQPALVTNLQPHEHTLLIHAAQSGNTRAVKLMLDLSFPIETRGDWNGTALHHAAWHGHAITVKLLLKRGADIQAKNQWGGDVMATAIHGSAQADRAHAAEIVKRLATKMAGTKWEKYLEQGRESGNAAVIETLERLNSANINAATTPPVQKLETHRAPLLHTKRKSQWPDSYALIERRSTKPGRKGGWRPAGLSAPVLRTRAAVEHIRKLGQFADYRRITMWAQFKVSENAAEPTRSKLKPPFDILEKYGQPPTEKPRGGPWQRIAWPPKGERPTPAEAVAHLTQQAAPGTYRIITLTRMFRAMPGKDRMVVRMGHVSNPDEGEWPTLAKEE